MLLLFAVPCVCARAHGLLRVCVLSFLPVSGRPLNCDVSWRRVLWDRLDQESDSLRPAAPAASLVVWSLTRCVCVCVRVPALLLARGALSWPPCVWQPQRTPPEAPGGGPAALRLCCFGGSRWRGRCAGGDGAARTALMTGVRIVAPAIVFAVPVHPPFPSPKPRSALKMYSSVLACGLGVGLSMSLGKGRPGDQPEL